MAEGAILEIKLKFIAPNQHLLFSAEVQLSLFTEGDIFYAMQTKARTVYRCHNDRDLVINVVYIFNSPHYIIPKILLFLRGVVQGVDEDTTIIENWRTAKPQIVFFVHLLMEQIYGKNPIHSWDEGRNSAA